jgi:hypothetical protein
MTERKMQPIKTTLNEPAYQKFLQLKEYSGFQYDADVLRWLILNQHEHILGTGRYVIPFSEKDMKQLEEWAKKVGMEPQEFVEKAVQEFLEVAKQKHGEDK